MSKSKLDPVMFKKMEQLIGKAKVKVDTTEMDLDKVAKRISKETGKKNLFMIHTAIDCAASTDIRPKESTVEAATRRCQFMIDLYDSDRNQFELMYKFNRLMANMSLLQNIAKILNAGYKK